MTRDQLDHVLRAAGDLSGHRRFVLVGSAAIFAWQETVPELMTLSREADLYALDVSEEEAERISDALEDIGHLSQFDETYGYYADGVGPHTAVLPVDWKTRSKTYRSPMAGGVVAVVPHPDDIALSKLCAGRDKDLDWIAAAYLSGLVDLGTISDRVSLLPKDVAADHTRILGLIEVVKRRALEL